MSTTRPPAYQQTAGQPEASRRGAHRARAKPFLAGMPILAGILVVLIAAGGAWYVLGDRATDSSKSQNAAIGSDGGDDQPDGTPPASADSSAGATTPAGQPSSTAGTGGGTGGDGSGAVDQSIPVRVLNGTTTSGLAKQWATKVEAKGWTVSSTGNTQTKGLSTTTVYYGSKADRNSAKGLVKDLGFGSIQLSASIAGSNLVVALGKDSLTT